MLRLIGTAVSIAGLAVLMVSFRLLLRNLRMLRRLEDEPAAAFQQNSPFISVLIPARNEEHTLLRCLDSLIDQRYPSYEIIVLDDESTDRTHDVVSQYAKKDERVTLVQGGLKPDGWAGKPWACWQLSQHARGEVLLFVDADTWYEPDVLARVAGLMERERPDLLTVMPRQVTVTPSERIVVPGLYIAFLASYPIWRVEDATYPDHALANGQFMCFDAGTYRRLGGHQAVRDQVIEDLAFALVVKRAGYRVIVRTAVESVHCRMYRSGREVFDGFSKNVYGGIGERPGKAIAVIAVMVATQIWPVVSVVASMRRRDIRSVNYAVPGAMIGFNVTMRALVAARFRFRLLDSLLAPLSAVAYILIMLRSIWWRYSRSGYRWKGRGYASAALRR